MSPKDFPAFSALLAELAEYYPMSKPNLEVITEGYFDGLKALPFGAVQALCTKALQRLKYWPTLAELRELGAVALLEDAGQRLALMGPDALEAAEVRRRVEREEHAAYLDGMLEALQSRKTTTPGTDAPSKRDSDLTYTPTVDAAERRAYLRAQLAALLRQTEEPHHA